MEKRLVERVSANLPVDYYWGNELHEGMMKNLSRKGMCIDAETCPPIGSDIEVILVLGDEVFNLPAKVNRTLSRNELSGIMSIELSEPSESYSKFVSIVQDYAYNWPSLDTPKCILPTDSQANIRPLQIPS